MTLEHADNGPKGDAALGIAASCTRSVGERLGYLRRSAGLSLTRASEITGVSKSELSRLENGGRRLKSHHLAALASAYGIDPHLFEQVVDYDPAGPGMASIGLACYTASALEGKGPGQAPSCHLSLPLPLPVGAKAYGIVADTGDTGSLPDRTLAVIDPDARTVLGDLVANVATWRPVLIILKRDDSGALAGFGTERHARDFHKVVAVLSLSHLGVAAP